jgi:hypothetical protein
MNDLIYTVVRCPEIKEWKPLKVEDPSRLKGDGWMRFDNYWLAWGEAQKRNQNEFGTPR